MANDSYLVLKNVSKVFEERKERVIAVDSVNLSIEEKEFVLITGPSGCGKSTLLHLIAGHERLSSGDILVYGENYNNVRPKDRNILFVPQNYNDDGSNASVSSTYKQRMERGALSFKMNALENMALELKNRKVPGAEINKRINEAAQILNIEKILKQKLTQLSPTELWLVALGRSIVTNLRLHIFDDPFSKIDAQYHAGLLEQLSDLYRRMKMTLIFAANDKDGIIAPFASKIFNMQDGKIV